MDYNDTELGDNRPALRKYPLRAILTRAVEQQHTWREAVERAGFECESLPLFRVVPIADVPLHRSLADINGISLLIVISPNAAAGLAQLMQYAAQHDAPLLHALHNAQYAVPGPGTLDALVRVGIAKARIICPIRRDHSYDAQALLQAVRAALQFGQLQPGPALILHGEQTSPELAVGLAAMGLPCRGVSVYRHGPITPEAAQTLRLAKLLTSAHEVVWVLSQTRAVSHLDSLARSLRPAGMKGHRALTIHPRIAQAATVAGFSQVQLISPSPVALVGALVSMADAMADAMASPQHKSSLSSPT
jgi:uroporphyrinogen-III synthase